MKKPRGMALLIVLVAVALLSLATLAPLRNEQQALQRERDTELLFIGEQFRQAIASYAAATPVGAARLPTELAQLLEDKRFPTVRRHLRRVYADPFTGAADWTLLKHQGAIVGVASRSTREPLKRHGFAAADAAFAEAGSYADWRFESAPGVNAVGPGAVAPGSGDSGDTSVPTGPAPANPPPPSGGTGADCLRSYVAALNRCGLDLVNLVACRSQAREAFASCRRG